MNKKELKLFWNIERKKEKVKLRNKAKKYKIDRSRQKKKDKSFIPSCHPVAGQKAKGDFYFHIQQKKSSHSMQNFFQIDKTGLDNYLWHITANCYDLLNDLAFE